MSDRIVPVVVSDMAFTFTLRREENEEARVYRSGNTSVTVYPGEEKQLEVKCSEPYVGVEITETTIHGVYVSTFGAALSPDN